MKILDLCCGGGLAAIGYSEGFQTDDIEGWDIENMSSRYPFKFKRGDAFGLTYEYIQEFDFIHISPPCQRYSKRTPPAKKDSHPHLIPNALRLGYASGKPFVVENVPGSTQWLRPTVTMQAGDKIRHFHCNFHVYPAYWPNAINIMSSSYSSKKDVFETWGIPPKYKKLTMADIRQGIPPLMTMHIAYSFMSTRHL